MSKYGWGWIWKSWFSPIGMVRRMMGYVPPEDLSTDPDDIKWRLTVIPVYGYGAKELVNTANKMFGKYFDKEDIADSVKGFLEAKQSGDYFDILEHFTFEVSPEERETILRGLANGKSWAIYHDEYKEVTNEVEWQFNFYRKRGRVNDLLQELARQVEQDGYPTKEELVSQSRKQRRGDEDDEGEIFA